MYKTSWRAARTAATVAAGSGDPLLVKRTSDRHNWLFRDVTFIINPTDYGSLRSVVTRLYRTQKICERIQCPLSYYVIQPIVES